MEIQEKQSGAVSAAAAPGLFRGASEACFPPENAAAEVASILQLKRRAFLRVSGQSMLPWFRPGETVFLRKTDFSEISRGDVIVFERAGRLLMRRVVSSRALTGAAETNAFLLTKGDAAAEGDGPVSAQDFLGRVEFLYRKGREIRLDSAWRKLFGKLLARISPASRYWLPHFCRVKNHFDDVSVFACVLQDKHKDQPQDARKELREPEGLHPSLHRGEAPSCFVPSRSANHAD